MSTCLKIQHVKDKKTTIKSMIILAILFFIFGLVSWVNTILIPYFELTLQLTRFQSYLVTFESMKMAYWILIPCFAYIVWYGAHGYRIERWSRRKLIKKYKS